MVQYWKVSNRTEFRKKNHRDNRTEGIGNIYFCERRRKMNVPTGEILDS